MTNELRKETQAPRDGGRRIDEIGWAGLLIITGALWLVPASWAPEGAWLTGVGVIMLGRNAARLMVGLRLDVFGIVAGSAALAAGTARILGGSLPLVPLLLVVLGTVMALKALARTERRDPARDHRSGTCRQQ